ncbi:hypothetical protein BC938DRAFT_474006 [Jimgerdemannia flammicorona]|uniref:Uncharacterized protein n=1 Tax=Jimgerdemannia flammicorona TaxID=994334 RepID=A0A433Q316_9FUNG|nr:hypothetical protein BC938DRAFT_474006 [Jimgerdemannia flammicorona]
MSPLVYEQLFREQLLKNRHWGHCSFIPS